MAKSAKTGGMVNTNGVAKVEPTSLGTPMHGMNPPAMVSPSYDMGGPVSKDVKNMRSTLMEMPDGRSASKKSARD